MQSLLPNWTEPNLCCDFWLQKCCAWMKAHECNLATWCNWCNSVQCAMFLAQSSFPRMISGAQLNPAKFRRKMFNALLRVKGWQFGDIFHGCGNIFYWYGMYCVICWKPPNKTMLFRACWFNAMFWGKCAMVQCNKTLCIVVYCAHCTALLRGKCW